MMDILQNISTFVQPVFGTVGTATQLRQIRAYALAGGYHSIIVTHNTHPVGVIRWEDIAQAHEIPESSLAKDIMLADGPVLTSQTSMHQARSYLEITGLDRLPVVDANGDLIGIVARVTLEEATIMEHNRQRHPLHDQPTENQVQRAFTVHPGMNVYSANRRHLGLVDRLYLANGVVTGFLVAVGPDSSRHKQLEFDLVDHLEAETIILAIDDLDFRGLPDAAADELS